jgi:phosphatidylglycerophosphate synthase
MILTPLADKFFPGVPALTYSTFAYAMLWVAAGLTVYTGALYFRAGLRHLHAGRKP